VEYLSIWPTLVCMAVLLAIAALPIFAVADTPPTPHANRARNLDGLRGFLAFGVFFHHQAIYVRFLHDGVVALPPSSFYVLIGQAGVAVFFMITGYLFWAQLLRSSGRINWIRLYVGRVFRIGPLYLAAALCVIVFVACACELHLNVAVSALRRSIAELLALGALRVPGEINGYRIGELFGVAWTLTWEWKFYASLIVLAPLARYRRIHLPAVLGTTFLALCADRYVDDGQILVLPTGNICATLFLVGMSCASLERQNVGARLPPALGSLCLAALLILMFLTCGAAYAAYPISLLGLALFLILSGVDLFGLLTSRPAVRLGNVSYGVYLLQGIVVNVVLSIPALRTLATGSPLGHWICAMVSATVLLVVATVAHVYVENTGIVVGKIISRRLAGDRGQNEHRFSLP
jgi:peptidoglycan/LPS O-acetylase OafA/YrhL